ncbi:MAG: T9SS type A sorting domain-containing protein [Bacteroidales bacterium]|nr:T9SS type A sorting domain-containing protein [Bacteroidales bacterium]
MIKGADKGDFVSIYSATGQLVMTAMAEPNKEIEVSHLPSGLYMIRCGVHVSRFVKK